MIVKYNNIQEDFIDMVTRAEEANRKISYVVLSEEEYNDLISLSCATGYPPYNSEIVMGEYMGIKIAGIKYHSMKLREEAEKRRLSSAI